MKKNRFFIYTTAALTALVFTACSNEEEMADSVVNHVGSEVVTLTATHGMDTRATLEGTDAKWETGDKLVVWTGAISDATKSDDFTCATGGASTGSFSGTLKFTSVPESSTPLTAYVASDAITASDDGTITLDLSEQAGTADKVLDYDLMWGTSTYGEKSFNFNHSVAVLKCTLKLQGITAATLADINISFDSFQMKNKVSFDAVTNSIASFSTGSIMLNDIAVSSDGTAEIYVAIPSTDNIDKESKLCADILTANGKGGTAILTSFNVSTEDGGRTLEAGKFYTANSIVSLTDVEMSIAPNMSLLQGAKKTRTPHLYVGTTDFSGYQHFDYTYTSSDASVATINSTTGEVTGVTPGTATINITNDKIIQTSYTVTVTAPIIPQENVNYVDLGLPSGTLWATMNVGAESETGYGTYFAWGETDGYTNEKDYNKIEDWSCYKWIAPKSGFKFTKYVTETDAYKYGYNGFYDDKTELDPEDDAATQNWGSAWKMPTIEQQQELFNTQKNTTDYTCKWQADYKNSGHEGLLITRNSTGASLFLPAAGRRLLGDFVSLDSSFGSYWASTIVGVNNSCAYILDIYETGGLKIRGYGRCYGFTVRAVRKQN